MRTIRIGLAFLAAVLTLAPLVAAEADQGNDRPDDAAWVEDCPPDMMCAANDQPVDNSTDDATQYGPGGCVDCSAPMPAEGIWEHDCPPGAYCIADAPPDDDDATVSAASGVSGALAVFATSAALLAFVTLRRRG